VPTWPAPPQVPDTWPDKDRYPEDKLPLGRINLHAIDRLTLTLPSTLLDPTPPERPLPLLDARIRLMRTPSPQAKDQAWRHLAGLARTERGDWNLFALAMAYPGLRARITPYVKRHGLSWYQTVQVHHTIAIEFLFAVHRLDLSRPWVLSRLLGAAYDHTSRRKKRPEPETLSLDQMTDADLRAQTQHQAPPADPRPVLDRLVRETRQARDGHRLTTQHAALVARTHLGGETLSAVAASLGIRQSNASKQRARAEYLIAVLLDRADLVTGNNTTHPEGASPRPDGMASSQ